MRRDFRSGASFCLLIRDPSLSPVEPLPLLTTLEPAEPESNPPTLRRAAAEGTTGSIIALTLGKKKDRLTKFISDHASSPEKVE